MAELKLTSFPNSPATLKALVTAEYGGVKVNFNGNVERGVTVKTEEFKKLNPNQKVPILETPNGTIWESNAIARYLGRAGNYLNIFGADSYEAGLVEQWIEWTRGEVEVPLAVWVYPLFGVVEGNETATQFAKDDIKKALSILNNHLKTRSFLVGERITLADIVVAFSLHLGFLHAFDANFRKPFINVNRWYLTVLNQPNVKKIVGEIQLKQ